MNLINMRALLFVELCSFITHTRLFRWK